MVQANNKNNKKISDTKNKTTEDIPKKEEKIVIEGPINAELEKTHKAFNDKDQTNDGQTDLKAIKNINSNRDQTKRKSINLSKVYKFWVIIQKDGEMVNNFGVREEEIAGVKMLIRTEKVGNNEKVIFKELYPEPRFDLNTISNNKNKIKKELNKLLQIKTILENNFYNNLESPRDYNFDLKDVNRLILQREIELHSIQYGKTFRYFFKIRDDGIPVIMYELENNGLKLKKEVKEKLIITEASEGKRLENHDIKGQINEELSKKGDKNWQKLLMNALNIIFLVVNMVAAFNFLAYNEDRSYEDTKQKLEELMSSQAIGLDKIMTAATSGFEVDNSAELNALLKSNQEILAQCIQGKLDDTLKPVVR